MQYTPSASQSHSSAAGVGGACRESARDVKEKREDHEEVTQPRRYLKNDCLRGEVKQGSLVTHQVRPGDAFNASLCVCTVCVPCNAPPYIYVYL